jgi:hypothetical protein
MVTIENKIIRDFREFNSWEEAVASNFCDTGTAMHYHAVIAEEGLYENEFYRMTEDANVH